MSSAVNDKNNIPDVIDIYAGTLDKTITVVEDIFTDLIFENIYEENTNG